jgi:CheY-like chemotaxis protein
MEERKGPRGQKGASAPAIVLIAEDSEDDYFLLQRAFTKINADAELTQCQDGLETLKYLETAKENPGLIPSLLLLDLKLPGMSGFEVLKWVRKDPVLKTLVANVLSSSGEPSDIRKAYELGANAYTVKPMGLNKYEEMMSGLFRFWLELSELPSRGSEKGS